ncbi:hypothetical protein L7F22_008188 [Adiantum nelumboides]|nr:hypothetical protein [Adiantum nelumboides]
MTKRDTVDAYCERFWSAFLPASSFKKISFREQIERFTLGLPTEIRDHCLEQKSASIQELMSHAKRGFAIHSGSLTYPTDDGMTQRDDQLVGNDSRKRKGYPEKKDARLKLTPQERARLIREGKCFGCGEPRHISAKCSKKAPKEQKEKDEDRPESSRGVEERGRRGKMKTGLVPDCVDTDPNSMDEMADRKDWKLHLGCLELKCRTLQGLQQVQGVVLPRCWQPAALDCVMEENRELKARISKLEARFDSMVDLVTDKVKEVEAKVTQVHSAAIVKVKTCVTTELRKGKSQEENVLKVSVVNNINSRIGNSSVGEEEHVLYGSSTITECLNGLVFEISANSFFQTNPRQAEVLYSLVETATCLEGNGEEILLDLFCGTGTIGLSLAKRVKHVYGFEVVPEAIADAQRNSLKNGITNATFIQGDLNKIQKSFGEQFPKPDVVIVDPNRPGLHCDLIKFLLKLQSKRIIYVSCNPATCARDLDYLAHGLPDSRIGGAYKLLSVQPVDMFPHTPHIECVCSLELT